MGAFKPEYAGALKYNKLNKVHLREVDLDEKWLQDRIAEDPTILGLGELTLIEREKLQPKGRLDLLLSDAESGIRYVTEIQLGSLDESHIIRSIEYWDIERKRFPQKEHMAVIVAEDVTTRFLNVLSLINSTVPLIVFQLDCSQFEGNLFLNFVKVLEHVELVDEEDSSVEKTDATYWANHAHKESMAIVAKLTEIFKSIDTQTSLTYNKPHIALGGEGKRNYAWFHPRKSPYLNFRMLFTSEEFEKAKGMAEEAGFTILQPKKNRFSFNLKMKDINENPDLFNQLAQISKKASF